LIEFIHYMPAPWTILAPPIQNSMQIGQAHKYVFMYNACLVSPPKDSLFKCGQMALDLHLDVDWLL